MVSWFLWHLEVISASQRPPISLNSSYLAKYLASICNVYIHGFHMFPSLRLQFMHLQEQEGPLCSFYHLRSTLYPKWTPSSSCSHSHRCEIPTGTYKTIQRSGRMDFKWTYIWELMLWFFRLSTTAAAQDTLRTPLSPTLFPYVPPL